MPARSFRTAADIDAMRQLLAKIPAGPTIVDFEEVIQLESVRANTRLWFAENGLIAFAYLDDFNNLCFEYLPNRLTPDLERDILAWGSERLVLRCPDPSDRPTLDASCQPSNEERIAVLSRMGFRQQEVRSLHFERTLTGPIPETVLPDGYSIRVARGEDEVNALVALHQAAFESDQMSVEYRLAMMRAPAYAAEMDWLVVSPTGDLAAFCVGSFDENDPTIGYLDPVGTHPQHRKRGLGSALMNHGLKQLALRGAHLARFGTSSENPAMISLGQSVGFKLVSESLWFEREINS